ncbi:hypothetical protein C5B42_01070 [Candidatus Cerribacteria bacterium 'Amazon FNV 2010 28 9']|uniref:Uncharacterized protein n=1 Tax=Candidatus Cerribacteria bacterium 'Amazon FNV 2010 28 9' TaxID=2081795 RepID=A0A317JSH0_9BACT|nr:MAG: hypothetical protein C5B42_01070 [Candidatus Cerribacteria bacterium 'Amazon FNV 2010 28 9']
MPQEIIIPYLNGKPIGFEGKAITALSELSPEEQERFWEQYRHLRLRQIENVLYLFDPDKKTERQRE